MDILPRLLTGVAGQTARLMNVSDLASPFQVSRPTIKAAATVNAKDFRGLKKLAAALGDRFVAGVVLYDGETLTRFGSGLYAVPISALWQPD